MGANTGLIGKYPSLFHAQQQDLTLWRSFVPLAAMKILMALTRVKIANTPLRD